MKASKLKNFREAVGRANFERNIAKIKEIQERMKNPEPPAKPDLASSAPSDNFIIKANGEKVKLEKNNPFIKGV